MRSIRWLLLAAAATAALAARVTLDSVSHFGQWRRHGEADAAHMLELTFAVKLENPGLMEQELYAVSTPGSQRYGKHLSKEQVRKLTQPRTESVNQVKQWLASNGVAASGVNGGSGMEFRSLSACSTHSSFCTEYISATVPVSTAEQLLGTKFYNFQRQQTNTLDSITRCQEYSLPEEIASHVDFVSPTTRFPMSSSLRVSTSGSLRGAADSDGQVTPNVISELYKTAGASTQGRLQGNKLAIASFLGQYFSHSDLASFFKQYAPNAVGNTPTMYGYNDDSSPGLEAQLDVEYAFSTASHVPGQAWNTAGQQPGNPENEPFLKWLHNITALSDSELPQVVSVSYGDNEDGVNFQYAQRVNVEFQKLGARGTSILFSSGDGGVSGGQAQPCPNGKFTPTFPAGSPFVTAVGGTRLQGASSETAAGLSSGGFSNYWARPSYQDDAVHTYLSTASGLPDPSHYNGSASAGFPDVAALAEGFQVVYMGFPTTVAGTSCASPTFAGVLALVNGARLVQGKQPMGWLNPWLYKNGAAFTDITTGSNPGCNTNGFPAAAGWDPVTGWGTPDYPKFVAAAMKE